MEVESAKIENCDSLDCPICYKPLKSPIYQCFNGHVACSSCCLKLEKRCSFCRSDIGDIRCLALEKVIEATIVRCSNSIYGCRQTTPYVDIDDQLRHEKTCIYIRCSCPSPNCTYIGSYFDLKRHSSDAHCWYKDNNNYKFIPFVLDVPITFSINLMNGKKMAIFQEKDEDDLIVVRALKELSGGVYVTVSCIAPPNPGVSNYSCSLAKLDPDLGTPRLDLMMVKKIQTVRENEVPKDNYMFIPAYMLSNENWMMQICIGRGFNNLHI